MGRTDHFDTKKKAHRDIKRKKKEKEHTKGKRKRVEKVTLKFKEESF